MFKLVVTLTFAASLAASAQMDMKPSGHQLFHNSQHYRKLIIRIELYSVHMAPMQFVDK
jgi:hypothetical protein